MKIEIWSDVVCPFCYIGKRVLENSIKKLELADQLCIEWKSFQLDPNTPNNLDQAYNIHIAEKKNISIKQVDEMFDYVTNRAKEEGLYFHLSQAKVANSIKAHLLIQFAKQKNKGSEIEEELFQAFFIDGKNISDTTTLIELGEKIGLNTKELSAIFTNDELAYNVKLDIDEAKQIGVSGVPFFVFDRKYAISGAQSEEVFMQTILKAYNEWQGVKQKEELDINKGDSCSIDENC